MIIPNKIRIGGQDISIVNKERLDGDILGDICIAEGTLKIADKNIDFNELSDVCWSSEKIFKTDIEFIRKPDVARKSVESIAKETNGRSRACKKCQYLMKCTPDISEVCSKAYVNGYKKGYNEYKNRLR